MSHILGTIFGLTMIFMMFIFGTDLVMMQNIYTSLDSLSTQVSHAISKNGYLTEQIKANFLTNYNATIYPIETNILAKSYEEGFIYGYYLEKDYSPIAISKSTINIKVKRFAVINIYN